MEVTTWTWGVAGAGLVVGGVLFAAQTIALVRPRASWTIANVYGGSPDGTDPRAYFAFYRGTAVADVFFWIPIHIAGCAGMLLGQRWGFSLGLIGSVPFLYTAVLFYFWDRELAFRKKTVSYWLFTWGMFPLYGAVEMGSVSPVR